MFAWLPAAARVGMKKSDCLREARAEAVELCVAVRECTAGDVSAAATRLHFDSVFGRGFLEIVNDPACILRSDVKVVEAHDALAVNDDDPRRPTSPVTSH